MKKLLSIGEVSRINDVPVKTLRYYDEIDLLKPYYINEETGYRYYSYEQFYVIDAIKFAKTLGLSLRDIKNMLEPADADHMLKLLKIQKEKAELVLQKHINMIKSIDYGIERMHFLKEHSQKQIPYIRKKDERYFILTKSEDNGSFAQMDLALKKLLREEKWKPYRTYRYGLMLDIASHRHILGEYMYLTGKPPEEDDRIVRLPAGKYACFQYRFFDPMEKQENLEAFLTEYGSHTAIMADEMNFSQNWQDVVYEINLFLGE